MTYVKAAIALMLPLAAAAAVPPHAGRPSPTALMRQEYSLAGQQARFASGFGEGSTETRQAQDGAGKSGKAGVHVVVHTTKWLDCKEAREGFARRALCRLRQRRCKKCVGSSSWGTKPTPKDTLSLSTVCEKCEFKCKKWLGKDLPLQPPAGRQRCGSSSECAWPEGCLDALSGLMLGQRETGVWAHARLAWHQLYGEVGAGSPHSACI
eukprot:CAMPEP_0170274490 /NCGR_PEP_ID=MMETSP0116_2-20130129/37216_1 /TAXON_ID=400756 /ORGANISM="Durinskia baltica, Strain CSIRO CS-38" /LENGTH=208 /DNA_ID=CAMNT_0010525735 /DNA_START=53 /DNA_END=676 /DNA_ORIENTATION=+